MHPGRPRRIPPSVELTDPPLPPEIWAAAPCATQRAIAWLRDPANRDEATAILIEQGRLDAGRCGDHLQEYVPRKVHALAVPPDQVQGVLDLMAELGQLTPPISPPDRYLDFTYLRQELP